MVLPQDVLLENGVSSESIFQAQSSTGLKNTIFNVASCANQHLQMVSIIIYSSVSYEVFSVFLLLFYYEKTS